MNKKTPGINLRFILIGVAIGVPAALLIGLVGFSVVLLGTQASRPLDSTPAPPPIAEPRGELPLGPVGFSECARYRDQDDVHCSSGFLLQLENGDQIGVIAAHSVHLGDPAHPLESIVFRFPGTQEVVAEFDTLHGEPGHAMDGVHLAVDYVLLNVDAPVDPALLLSPDPRRGPQPGERVTLFSGVGGTPGELQALAGTVMSASPQAAWVLMDKGSFRPGGMSGSPVVSQHTGQVVGMAVAASPRLTGLLPFRYRILIGLHPIGSIVDKARQANTFPSLSDYQGDEQ
jgi:hypothetical protein